jgi:AcrR family transcriptional regulator
LLTIIKFATVIANCIKLHFHYNVNARLTTLYKIVLQYNRRKPSQRRGILKYEKIISTTKSLVGLRGSDDVSIRDIAKHADVAPSSIYHYFDDKNDIIIAIMEVHFDESHQWLADRTSTAKTLVEWVQAIVDALDFFISVLKSDPDWLTIWMGVQASPALREYDNEDVMKNASLLQKQFCTFCPHILPSKALAVCVLFLQFASTTAKMALLLDQEMSESLIQEYKHLIRMRIRELSV